MSEEGLQTAQKRREAKSKVEKKIYPFDCRVTRIARKDKKALLNDQCKKENNRIEKNRDLFTKTRGNKGIFHAKMGTIND